MFREFVTVALIAVFSYSAFPQALETKTNDDPAERSAKLEKEAVFFLRESLADANNLRTLENRITFTSELAGLMWFHDEREARSIFSGVFTDFRDLLAQIDGQMNSLGLPGAPESDYLGGFFADIPDRARIMQKFTVAMAVRQQIAGSIAEHDPETAMSFYYDSGAIVSNPELRKMLDSRDTYFEMQLLTQAIKGNSPKSAQFAARSLEIGFKAQHVELLKKMYEDDPDKAADFASAIMSKLKSGKIDSAQYYGVSSLLSFGGQALESSRTTGGKKAIYSQSDLRDISDTFAQSILSGDAGVGSQFVDVIDKYSPGRGAQIRARAGSGNVSGRATGIGFGSGSGSGNTFRVTGGAAPPRPAALKNPFVANSARGGGTAPADAERAAREKAEEKAMSDVMSLGKKELPKEERDRIVGQARKIIAETPGRDKKILGLSMLATQVANMGDKALAGEIMKDASNFVNPAPKNYQDFIFSWMLVSGYASADTYRAFPLLEDLIGRANETINAMIKVGEFMDASGEIINDGEVQVGAFGGSMIRGLMGEMGMADPTIQALSKADFARTRELTNRFERPEVRMLAKMIVLRAVLKKPEAAGSAKVVSLN